MENEKEYCEYCQALVKDAEGETVKSNTHFEKYVPHKYVYRRVCIECVEQNKHTDLEEHGFHQCGYSMVANKFYCLERYSCMRRAYY